MKVQVTIEYNESTGEWEYNYDAPVQRIPVYSDPHGSSREMFNTLRADIMELFGQES